MKKRILSLLLTLTLLLSVAAPAQAVSSYHDVPSSHWAYASVTRATRLGLFTGTGDGQFGLGQGMTRAAFATALVRLFGWDELSPAHSTFSDVKKGSWYYTAVETAVANGAIPTSGSTFHPDRHITRQEMASMLVRSLGYASLAGALSTYSSPFTDVKVNKGFITIAYDLGIVNGVGNGRFSPNGTATREQAAVMLVRLYDSLHSSCSELSELGNYTPLRIPTPDAKSGTELPTTPLEPITELYLALQKLKNSGSNMGSVALCLTAGGVETIVSDGEIIASKALTAKEVQRILRRSDVRLHYSQRYDSAYCIYTPNKYQTATVWYQSEESHAAKIQLAQLFGIKQYMME